MKPSTLRAALACAAFAWQAGALAQPAAETPPPAPAGAEKFIVLSSAGAHGTVWRWRAADGADMLRESVLLRGQVWEQELAVHVGANGQPERIAIRGRSPNGDSGETFAVRDGVAEWKSHIESGRVRYDGRSQYLPAEGTWATPYAAELLHRAPNREVPLLPGGRARMVKLVDVEVGAGPTAKKVTSWAIEGLSLGPQVVLLDADGRFFGWAGGMALLPEAYVGEHAKLHKAQIDALAARQPAIARRFGQPPAQPVAFTHVRLFDAEAARFLEDQTVVVEAGRIRAVGAAGYVNVPPGARVIDGHGHTLTPGLWDCHMHAGSDEQGALLLSLGETSARDPGSEVQRALDRRGRIARGELLYPAMHSSLLIDGKGPLAAQIARAVTSLAETLAAVRFAKDNGFTGVKFYGSLDPQWLAPAVAEAHKLGLHVHGHLPAGLRPSDAIAVGYDEFTHINFVLMQALPDEIVKLSNGMARFQGPGRYGKDLDLSAEPMASLIREIGRRRLAVDPTLVAFEGLLVAEKGEVAAAFKPFVGTMPPMDERGFKAGGQAPPAGVTRADYRASFGKLLELTKRLHDAGALIVAGTDGWGLELVRELELYVQAGLTPAQALQTATINAARLVGAQRETGSIAVGKKADLVLVEGDPSRDIGRMRQTRWVMQAGVLMNADELRDVVGFAGRPK